MFACFFCSGESVEENANVVVRLLIRRPECFGPALRGEGGNGLLAAIEEAIKISEDPARDGPSVKKDRRFPTHNLYASFYILYNSLSYVFEKKNPYVYSVHLYFSSQLSRPCTVCCVHR